MRDEVLSSDDGAQLVIDADYKRDPHSVVAHIFNTFQKLLSIQRPYSETFCNYELMFNAQLCKFNVSGKAIPFSDVMTALYPLANSTANS